MDLSGQGRRGPTTLARPLGPRDFTAGKSATDLAPDAFRALSQGVLYRTLHGATEHHTTLKLAGHTGRNEFCVEIGLADLFDVDMDGNAHHIGNFLTQPINILALLTNHNARTRRMNCDSRILRRTLDRDLADRRLLQALFQELANSHVVQQVL